ncbi:MAG: YraN family protein [Clostridiales bacterium]|nr:YraN family protein [Clostridiales bacterium]
MTTGERGEQRAAEYLQRKGFRILDRNYRTRCGEIDIICADDRYLVFAEVKTRSSTVFGMPCEAVTSVKQRKLVLAAQQWLYNHPTELQPRFDVVEILVSPDRSTCRIRHIPDAFEVV